jgi:hypothetical protein
VTAKKKKPRAKRAPPKVSSVFHKSPTTDRDRIFCAKWLEHFDHNRAWREAGFKVDNKSSVRAQEKVNHFAEWLRPYQEAKVKKVAETLVVGQTDILKTMAAKAVFNPLDYIEKSTEPLYEEIGSGRYRRKRLVLWNNQPIYPERMKPLSELTPEQARAVEVYETKHGLSYRLPDNKTQHGYLTSMGRQYGMFLEKLILERHKHTHKHAHLHLEGVPTTKLQQIRAALVELVPPEFVAQLGLVAQEAAEKSQAIPSAGVLMPATRKEKP